MSNLTIHVPRDVWQLIIDYANPIHDLERFSYLQKDGSQIMVNMKYVIDLTEETINECLGYSTKMVKQIRVSTVKGYYHINKTRNPILFGKLSKLIKSYQHD